MSLYDTEKISEYLNKQDPCIDITVLNCTDSTNDYAKRLIVSDSDAVNRLVLAREQSSGKGQYERTFFSPKDRGIYMSLVVKPESEPDELANITLMSGICVREALHTVCELDCRLKYVNDVICAGKKICGILTEAVFEGSECKGVVVGIGINVLHSDCPADLANVMTCIEDNIEKKADVNKLIAEIVNNIFDALEKFDVAEIKRKYCEYVLELHETNSLK